MVEFVLSLSNELLVVSDLLLTEKKTTEVLLFTNLFISSVLYRLFLPSVMNNSTRKEISTTTYDLRGDSFLVPKYIPFPNSKPISCKYL